MKNRKSFINNAEEIIPPVNDSPWKKVLVIGDTHAAFDKLMTLWKKLSVTEEDLVIFLGDYLYGMGDKNIETLQWLIEQKKQKNIIFLRGNVDDTYLHRLFDLNGNFFNRLNSRVVSGIKNTAVKKPSFPNKIFDFLNNLPLSYQITIGGRLDLNKPIKVPHRNILMLDTHAKVGGSLSCVDLLSGEIWQSGNDLDSVIFICSGNSCRSPMAKYIMRHLLAEKGLSDKVVIDSAGCNTRASMPSSIKRKCLAHSE